MGVERLACVSVAAIAVAAARMSAAADMPTSVPPALPGAVADASGLIAVVAQDGGGIAGIDMATGQTRWRSMQGRWPLASAHPWVAVALPDPSDRRLLRVRFLRAGDGTLLVDAKPVRLPAVMSSDATWEGEGLSVGAGDTTVQLQAWVPRSQPGASRDRQAGHLRIRWKTQTFIGGGGMRPPERGPASAGLAVIDPATGAVELRPDDAAEGPEPALPSLPASWRPVRGAIYWSGSWSGGAWTDKPRMFWIGGSGVAGFFSYENPPRRLVLNRFRSLAPLPSVELAVGGEWAPQVSMDGRFLILSKGNAGVETFTLIDLLRPEAAGASTRLPHLEPRFRSPFSVVGRSLFYVAEGEGAGAGGRGTAFLRWLVCVDWASGKIRWKHDLPARFLPPPTARTSVGMPP